MMDRSAAGSFPRFLSGAPLKRYGCLLLQPFGMAFPRFLSGAPLKHAHEARRIGRIAPAFPRFLSGAPLKLIEIVHTWFDYTTFPKFLSGAPLKLINAYPLLALDTNPSLDSYLGLH